jgi:hypothetical protein
MGLTKLVVVQKQTNKSRLPQLNPQRIKVST